MGLFDFLKKEKDVILGVEFPMYDGRKTWKDNSNTDKYQRIDYYFRGYDEALVNSYSMKFSQYGFNKISDIKYTRGNAYVIVEKESNSCVGYISVDIPYRQLNIGEIGYVIGEKYQKKGYAYEALSRILEVYFTKKKLYMLEAKYNEDNIASAKLLKKLGFVHDGKLRNRRIDLMSGERKDMIVCSMTFEEYKEITGD